MKENPSEVVIFCNLLDKIRRFYLNGLPDAVLIVDSSFRLEFILADKTPLTIIYAPNYTPNQTCWLTRVKNVQETAASINDAGGTAVFRNHQVICTDPCGNTFQIIER